MVIWQSVFLILNEQGKSKGFEIRNRKKYSCQEILNDKYAIKQNSTLEKEGVADAHRAGYNANPRHGPRADPWIKKFTNDDILPFEKKI